MGKDPDGWRNVRGKVDGEEGTWEEKQMGKQRGKREGGRTLMREGFVEGRILKEKRKRKAGRPPLEGLPAMKPSFLSLGRRLG